MGLARDAAKSLWAVACAGVVACSGCEPKSDSGAGGGPTATRSTAPSEQPRTASEAAAPTSNTPSDASTPPTSGTVVNALPIPTASVGAVLNPSDFPPYSGPTGSIEGVVVVDGDRAPPAAERDFAKCPSADKTYGKLFREGAPLAGGARPLTDALVGVTGYNAYLPARGEAERVVFDDCALPRTIPLMFGQRLEIANKSKLLFAPAFREEPNPAALIPPPLENGDPVKLYARRPGHYTLFDSVRSLPFLRADVYVLMFPLFAVTDGKGHFRIDGVPVGAATVSARLAAIQKETSQEVVVVEGAVKQVTLKLHYVAAAPDAGAPQDAGPKPPPMH